MVPRNPRITPTQLDLYSSNMSDLYQSLEGEIIRIIIKRLNSGHSDITMWQAQKLQISIHAPYEGCDSEF